ncbi:odorant receptor 22b-like [Diachasmimorpha longicaudata]|uniref:odorant receptor 22b-like n=1 Tax=Diachasmimorpha longicaudata TaxID=58733 RepID=UPI0030B8EFBA
MLSDTELEPIKERFIRAQNVFNYVSQPIAFMGMWPVNVTTGTRIRTLFYYIYHLYRIGMELFEFFMVFPNLGLVIENLAMTGVQIGLVLRLSLIRFSAGMHRLLHIFKDLRQLDKFNDMREIEIFLDYSESCEKLYRIVLWPAAVACSSWWFTPFQNYLIARFRNRTFVYESPWRMPPIEAMERTDVIVIVHVIELPVVYISFCYMMTYCIYFSLVNQIRCQLVIINHKVRNLRVDQGTNVEGVFKPIVERHVTIFELVKSLNDWSQITLMCELLVVSLTLGLLIYNIMVVSESSQDFSKVMNFGFYVFNMLSIMFTNCYMGQSLEDEALNLADAFYDHDWTHLPITCQKSFVICMIRSQRPLQLTAGGFYKFSLNGFTSIIKSIAGFYSMLRATT